MSRKVWYTIYAKCIVNNASLTCNKNDVVILAKVKSAGNAYTVTKALQETYKDNFIVYYE